MEAAKGYHYQVNRDQLSDLIKKEKWLEALEVLAEPLHMDLYRSQSFDFLDDISAVERIIISFDYVQSQVGQGGFIQLIQNGYASLLLTVIEALQELNICPEIEQVMDDALKVYVLNIEILGKETSVKEFGKLYEEFKEFDILETQFADLLPASVRTIVLLAAGE